MRHNRALLSRVSMIVGLTVGCGVFSDSYAQQPEKLNVVLFLIDDLGWNDVGCYGSDYYQTPHIDQLAEEGVKFTNGYAAAAICSPSRASILTGRYPARMLLTNWIPDGRWDRKKHRLKEGRFVRALPLEEYTLAEALREVGYQTGFVGKWHLGGLPFYYPEHQGFQVNIGGNDMGNPGNYFYPYNGTWRVPTTPLQATWHVLGDGEQYAIRREGEYLTDRLTDESIEFIRKNQDQPFFLMLSHYAVHTPLQAKEEKIARYEEVPEADRQGKPTYAAMIESVDESVGRVMQTLQDLQLDDRTLVIFTSDNGAYYKASSSRPLRGNKGSYFEGGIRVPFIIKSPTQVNKGIVSDVPVIGNDLYPTVLAATGLPLRPYQHLDGENLIPIINSTGGLEREALFWHFPHYNGHPDAAPVGVIRRGPWKLIEYFDEDRQELYNLEEDLSETQDLSEQRPEQTSRLYEELQVWRESVRAEMPQPNLEYEGK